MAVNLGFLYTTVGRFVFVVFVGVMMFDVGGIYAIISMCLLYLAFLVHIFIRFRYPRYVYLSLVTI